MGVVRLYMGNHIYHASTFVLALPPCRAPEKVLQYLPSCLQQQRDLFDRQLSGEKWVRMLDADVLNSATSADLRTCA